MIVTRESNPAEVDALRRWCSTCDAVDASRWALLGHLRVGQAVALPITEEAGGDLRLFTIAPRLTPHVRHREKYVDVPVPEQRAFVFASTAQSSEQRALTLRQFVFIVEHTPVTRLDGYLQRGDFSRWIGDVFGDYPLAAELRALEAEYRAGVPADSVSEVVAAIRARYDLASGEDRPATP